MDQDSLFYLGKITKISGYKGELSVFLDVDSPREYFNLKSVLIKTPSGLIPFFFENFQFKKDQHFKVKLQGIDTEERAKNLVNSELYLPLETLPKLEGKKFYYHEIIGFTVTDKHDGLIGEIMRVIDLPSNPLFEVKSETGSEILVPINDNVIQTVNREGSNIDVILPEGLLDLYT